MRLINYSKVRRSAATDLKKYERLGVKMFTDALKLQAKPNPSPLPMQEAYVKFYQTVFVDSAKKEFDRIRQDNREKAFVPDDFFLNTWKEWIREWVLQNLGGLIKDVNDNTLKQIQQTLGEGIEQGLNPFQLEKLLFEQIPNINRARAIARTESTRAYNEGKKRSATDWANQTGTKLWKIWIHGGAKEPRFQHIQAQNKPIRADQPFVFTTKGVEVFMDKPGDVNGGAAQTINCSCVVVYVSEAYARRNFPDAFNTNLPVPSENITPTIEAVEAFIPNQAKYTDINQFKDQYLNLAKGNKNIQDNTLGEFIDGKYETVQNALAEIQGFRGLPKVLSDEEFLRLSKDPNYSLIYRGISDVEAQKLKADKLIDQYIKGDLYGARNNTYGNGTYWAADQQYVIANAYADGIDKNVLPALINKSEMKIGSYGQLRSQWQKESYDYVDEVVKKWEKKLNKSNLFSNDFRKTNPDEFAEMVTEAKAISDFGSWATSKGYDGYVIKGRNPGFSQFGIDSIDFIVTLNRTKTIVPKTLRGKL